MSELDGAVVIGKGKSGEVLKLRDGTVLKLFGPDVAAGVVEREFRVAGVIEELGVGGAAPLALLTVDGHRAIRFAFVPGRQVLDMVKRNPFTMTWALVRLAWHQARVHAVRVAPGVLPDTRATIAARIATSQAGPAAIRSALERLATLPDGDRLCHGDLHLGNVIDDGSRWTIIDWPRSTVGASVSDAARTRLLIQFGASHFADRFVLVRILRWCSAQLFSACYCMFTHTSPARLREWELPLAVAWMQGQDSYRAKPLARQIARSSRQLHVALAGTEC